MGKVRDFADKEMSFDVNFDSFYFYKFRDRRWENRYLDCKKVALSVTKYLDDNDIYYEVERSKDDESSESFLLCIKIKTSLRIYVEILDMIPYKEGDLELLCYCRS